jgi:hypothetical protein
MNTKEKWAKVTESSIFMGTITVGVRLKARAVKSWFSHFPVLYYSSQNGCYWHSAVVVGHVLNTKKTLLQNGFKQIQN